MPITLRRRHITHLLITCRASCLPCRDHRLLLKTMSQNGPLGRWTLMRSTTMTERTIRRLSIPRPAQGLLRVI